MKPTVSTSKPTEKNLIAPRKSETFIRRTKNQPKTPAQSSTLLQVRPKVFDDLSKRIIAAIFNAVFPLVFRMILDALFSSGARINEVLKIKGTDIDKSGRIVLKGSKGSSGRMFVPLYLKDEFIKQAGKNKYLFDYISRFVMYRFLKKNELFITMPNSHNSKVTHSFRYVFISDMQELTHEIENTSMIVGHKSINSTQIYLANEKSNKKRH